VIEIEEEIDMTITEVVQTAIVEDALGLGLGHGLVPALPQHGGMAVDYTTETQHRWKVVDR